MLVKDITLEDIHFKILINPDTKQGAQKKVYENGIWEPKITELVKKLLQPSQTFIDIGAAAGWFTLLASSIVGESGKVIAFEPNPTRFQMIKESASLNGFSNIIVSDKALGEKQESTFIGGRCKGEISKSGIPIETTTLDRFLIEKGIKKVDLVKMDIEGMELKALKGMTETVKNNPQMKIICELHPKLLKKYGDTQEELLRYVQSTLGMKTENIEWRYWLFARSKVNVQ